MNPWEKARDNPDDWAFQGWRQHWLLLWQDLGQQYLQDCRHDLYIKWLYVLSFLVFISFLAAVVK